MHYVLNKAHLIVHWGKKFCPAYTELRYIHTLIGNTTPQFICSAIVDPETLKIIKKSLGLFNSNMYLKQTPIACKELVFHLAQIPKDTISAYMSLCFLFDEAVDPPVTKMYIDPVIFHQKSRSGTSERIPKTIIFFNTKAQAIGAYIKSSEYLNQLHLMHYMEKETLLIMAVFH